MFSHCTLPSSLQEEPLAPAQHFATVCLCFPAAIKKISSNAQPLHNWTGGVMLANCPQIQPQLLAPFWLSSFNWFSTARSRVRSFYKFYFEPQGELQGVAYQMCVHDCLCTSPQWKRFTNRTWDQYWHNDLTPLGTKIYQSHNSVLLLYDINTHVHRRSETTFPIPWASQCYQK